VDATNEFLARIRATALDRFDKPENRSGALDTDSLPSIDLGLSIMRQVIWALGSSTLTAIVTGHKQSQLNEQLPWNYANLVGSAHRLRLANGGL
jgi:hypothetical protein